MEIFSVSPIGQRSTLVESKNVCLIFLESQNGSFLGNFVISNFTDLQMQDSYSTILFGIIWLHNKHDKEATALLVEFKKSNDEKEMNNEMLKICPVDK